MALSPTAGSRTAAAPPSSGARLAEALDAATAEELCAGVERALAPGGCAAAGAADPAPVLRAVCGRLEAENRSLPEGTGPLLAALLQADAPALLLAAVPSLEFEAQKLAVRLCEGVLGAGCGGHLLESVSAYLCGRSKVVELLLWGVCDDALTFMYGELLLLGVRDTGFARVLLEQGADIRLVSAAASRAGIEVRAMALACLRGLMLESGDAVAEHLEDQKNFRHFFAVYHELLLDENMLVQRPAQDLLARVLLSSDFRSVRTMYISSVLCLKLHMSLLLHPVISVRMGAFHVFKIFVANPYKRPNVQALLHRNKEQLARLLRRFCAFSEADDNCSADLAAVLAALLELIAPAGAPSERRSQDAAPSRPCLVAA